MNRRTRRRRSTATRTCGSATSATARRIRTSIGASVPDNSMANLTMIGAVRIFAAALGVAFVCGAAAQSPAVSAKDEQFATKQQAQQRVQPGNNEPGWSEVRTAVKQTPTLHVPEPNFLVPP